MRGLAALAVACLAFSCAALLEPAVQPDGAPFPDRIDQPVEIQVPGQDAVVLIEPGGGLSLELRGGEPLALQAPISFPVSGFPGYSVTLSPDGSVALSGPPSEPSGPRGTTVADVALDVAEPFVVAGGAIGGNPMLGTAVIGALRVLIGALGARKAKKAAAAA